MTSLLTKKWSKALWKAEDRGEQYGIPSSWIDSNSLFLEMFLYSIILWAMHWVCS